MKVAKEKCEVSIRTGAQRGASLSEPLCGIFLCLVGGHHQGSLHWIAPLSPDASQRFLQGSTDTFSLSCPDLGPLTGLLIGPECGTWNVEEVSIIQGTRGERVRFVCRQTLGTRDDPAAVLTPLLPDRVIYGSGSTAQQLTSDEAARIQAANLEAYGSLKRRILAVNALLVLLGTLTEATVWSPAFVSLFAVGGVGGLLYQYLLQESVDAIGQDNHSQQVSLTHCRRFSLRLFAFDQKGVRKLLSNPISRLLLSASLAAAVYFTIKFIDQRSAGDATEIYRAQQLLNFASGLLTFKLAVAVVALSSNTSDKAP